MSVIINTCCLSPTGGLENGDTPEILNYNFFWSFLLGILLCKFILALFYLVLPSCMVFPSSHVWMWELNCEESWALKNWCFWTVVLEKTLENPLDCKEIIPVNPKGNQSWILIGRTDAETEALILWPSDAKNWLIGKNPDAGKHWRQEEKGITEDEMVGWHHQLNGHESE